MQEIHAVLLTGGSAFGLAAADGVMRFLEERGCGYVTPWGAVPIVPAVVLFDLNIGSPAARPTADSGYEACRAATASFLEGSVGAGTGATVGKWAGIQFRMKGGIGAASVRQEDLIVSALVAVNAVGDVVGRKGEVIAGARSARGWIAEEDPVRRMRLARANPLTNTTLAAVLTNARLSKVDVHRVAQRAHDGMARAITPVHTSFDGDVAIALASGSIAASLDLVAELGAHVVCEAIRRAVDHAGSIDEPQSTH